MPLYKVVAGRWETDAQFVKDVSERRNALDASASTAKIHSHFFWNGRSSIHLPVDGQLLSLDRTSTVYADKDSLRFGKFGDFQLLNRRYTFKGKPENCVVKQFVKSGYSDADRSYGASEILLSEAFFPESKGFAIRFTDSTQYFLRMPRARGDLFSLIGVQNGAFFSRVQSELFEAIQAVQLQDLSLDLSDVDRDRGIPDGRACDYPSREGSEIYSVVLFYIIHAMLDALQAIHEMGIVHWDVSEENILIMWDGRIRVSDFEFSRPKNVLGHMPTQRAITLAPETIYSKRSFGAMRCFVNDKRGFDEAVDLWALGIVLSNIWSGCQPYITSKDEHFSVARHGSQILHFNFESVVGPDPGYEPVLRALLTVDPSQRTMAKARAALHGHIRSDFERVKGPAMKWLSEVDLS